jgi:flagellar hook-associated protein 2
MAITSLGLGSGLDLEGLISNLVSAEGTPASLRIAQQEAEFQAELSAMGSFRSALDTFNMALDALNSLESFSKRTATSSNETLFTVKADATAVTTAHDVEVIQLAAAHKLSSDPFAPTDVVGTGNLTITVGEASMTVAISEEHATLAGIRDAINASEDNPGVQASIVTGEDGSHLVLTSTSTGAASAMTITDGTTNMTEVQAAMDAELRVDGIAVHSASNEVTGAIEGVTIELHSASPGTTARLEVTLDVAGTRQAIENFVHSYNTLQTTLNDLTAYDGETGIGGPLLGDSMVLLFQDQLRREMNEAVSGLGGDFDSLVDIGLETNLEDGTLTIDEEQLTKALEENFDDIGTLFASADGYAARLQGLADTYLESDGLIEVRTEGLQKSIDGLEEDMEQLNAHLASYEARLRAEFTALDQLVAELTATSEFLAQQLAMLPTFETPTA